MVSDQSIDTREYFVLQSQRLQNLLRYTRSTIRILTRDQHPSQSGALRNNHLLAPWLTSLDTLSPTDSVQLVQLAL